MPKLVHLSIDQASDGQDMLCGTLNNVAPVRLDSLHLNTSILSSDPEAIPLLTEIVNGEREDISIARIVVYGSREETEDDVDLTDLGELEWRTGVASPFADFDGR